MQWIKINFTRALTVGLLAAGLIALAVLFIPGGTAQAAAVPDEPPPPGEGAPGHALLEKAYQQTLKIIEKQEKLFEGAERLAARLEALAGRAREKGLDVSVLENALAENSSAAAAAREAYDRAGAALQDAAGFDADGKVTDVENARATLKEARTALKESRETLGGTIRDMRQAVQAFREANPRPAATEPAPVG